MKQKHSTRTTKSKPAQKTTWPRDLTRAEEKERARDRREWAAKDIERAIVKLADARAAAEAIERHIEGTEYFDDQALGLFVRATISEAGAELEQALCNLGVIKEKNVGYFVVGDGLKRQWPQPQKAEAAKGVNHAA